MAKKKEVAEDIKFLKSKVEEGKAVIGRAKVIKELKAKNLNKVFLASNCPQQAKEEIKHYAGLGNVDILELEQNNEELGVVCKKNFFISVLGIIGE